ncbi:MAG: hypothetical protein K1X79_11180 [Oligoflexia bacterium]|nr:hypothetical protein [Oligoflexia bacterium]
MPYKPAYYFKRLLGCASIALAFSSCSLLFGAPQSTSIELPASTSLPTEQVSDDPYLYRLTSTRAPTYLTAIQDCTSKRPNTLASTRRLLVGLKQLRIQEQTTHEVKGSSVLVSLIEAELDAQPIKLASLSVGVGNCVRDFILWSSTGSDPQQLGAITANMLEFLGEHPQLITDPT